MVKEVGVFLSPFFQQWPYMKAHCCEEFNVYFKAWLSLFSIHGFTALPISFIFKQEDKHNTVLFSAKHANCTLLANKILYCKIKIECWNLLMQH